MYPETKNEQEKVYVNPNSMNDPSCAQISEFKNLYDHLQNAVNHTNDLSNELYRYGNSIKVIQETKETMDKLVSKAPQGLIEMLFEEIFKLQKTNASLVVLANHLRETIGQ
jgi:hypothetical protein